MSLLLLLNPAANAPVNIGVDAFSEHGIADHVQKNPEKYRRHAAFVADYLQWDIDRLDAITAGSDHNSVAVTKDELKRQQAGFQEVATTIPREGDGILTRQAAEKVGRIISTLRTGFIAWCEGNPEIAETAQKLASVVFATFALSWFDVPAPLAVLRACCSCHWSRSSP